MTPRDKLMARIAVRKLHVIRITVVTDQNGEPMLFSVDDEKRLESGAAANVEAIAKLAENAAKTGAS